MMAAEQKVPLRSMRKNNAKNQNMEVCKQWETKIIIQMSRPISRPDVVLMLNT
jgi:hypothetical protein